MPNIKSWDAIGEKKPPTPKRSRKRGNDPLPAGASHGSLFVGKAKVSSVYYRADDFVAGRMSSGKSSFGFVMKRKGALDQVKEGTSLDLRGTWVTSKFGLQVDVSSFEILSQDEKWGFITSIKRFIPNKYQKDSVDDLLSLLWDDFGPEVESLVINDLVTNWPFLFSKGYSQTTDMSIVIKAILDKRKKEKRVKTIGDLKGMGIRGKIAEKMFDEFGEDCVQAIKESPYSIAIEYGIKDFDRIDEIGKKAGIPLNDIERLKLSVVSTMEEIRESGHCSIMADDLIKIVGDKLSIDDHDEIIHALDVCISDVMVILEEDGRVYSYDLHESECIVARNMIVRQMAIDDGIGIGSDDMKSAIEKAAENLGIEYTDEQINSVFSAWGSPISVITGGPGTGKTTVCRAIVSSLESAGFDVALCCPTGRGAKRLSESVGREAKTIHRLIGYNPNTEKWDHDIFDQLPHSAIIVDEASMVDIDLMRVLMDATMGFSRLVLVGDYDQLPSVGPGRLLRDVIESDLVPVTRLNRIFRQGDGSDIIGVSHDIRMGEVPAISSLSSENLGEGMCSFYQCDDARVLSYKIPKMVRGLSKVFSIDPMDVQVITPMRVGPLGTDSLNQILQGDLNPSGKGECRIDGRIFRVGDKIMQIRNDYDRGIFNGDSGMIVEADQEGVVVLFDDEWKMAYDRYDVPYFLIHCYAMTIHRSQGSEFPAGIMVLHESHKRMLQRNLFYTGVSRFKRAAIICGQRSAMNISIDNDMEEKRMTGLKDRMEDVLNVLDGM